MHFFRAVVLFVTATAVSAAAQSPLKLIPVPREVAAATAQQLPQGVQITCTAPCSAEDTFAIDDLKTYLASQGIAVNATSPSTILVTRYGSPVSHSILAEAMQKKASDAPAQFPAEMKAEGYAIIPDGKGLAITAASDAGIFYALQTVKQMFFGFGNKAVLQTATIRDWPAMRYRGLDDDLSRGPFPTLEFQKKQIRTIAAYKVNIYSPYFEHTMQYSGHPLMAPPGGSLSQAEARELVAYAAKYHITIIPEQEAFGHLHYLLNWEKYSSIAETPHGQVLAPHQPDAQKLTHDMFQELAQIYPGPFLHLGADETQELGKGQTKAEVDSRGLGPVYLDFLQKIVADLQPLNRKLLFWGDIAYHEPDLLKQLPDSFKKATIAVAWEYNPQPKGFDHFIKPFTDAGFETWVAPGVNNWSRVYPNWNNALANIQQFTADGQKLGATGQLNTVWNDDGEALFNANWYGVLFGAEAAWHQGAASIPAFQSSYGENFHGDATGKINEAQREMAAAHQLLKDSPYKVDGQDLLFWQDPWNADGQRIAGQIRPILSELRMHAERALILVAEARNANPNLRETDALDVLELGARRMDLIGLKFQISDEIATSYAHAFALQTSTTKEDHEELAHELGSINAVNGKLQDLRNNYSLLRDLYEKAWLKSYRPYFLRNNLERYDFTIQMWLGRIDRMRTAQRQWANSQTLPPAADLGIPAPPVAP
ncbi:glycoside hydrolase family 20 zincin-like fold domain-containing protein [Edaphobacter aggregans]|uniref:glycoside hydrolase family 20 zincin-like fold domain-containing protein n=1 Tax=Edaphobacter aggregans TaxID=570835 RepID=UPI000552BECE|nr:glycoside hydrolase family 20 zincin-like fold domain-containing protein [Edaphobacter aggregans]